jgi:osomolarity two-component system sensor histidine kinase NIK1
VPDYAIRDPNRLYQVLANLVGNALKFTKRGNIKVSIKTAHQQTNECTLELSIADTGVGIEESKLDLIFRKFQQANDSVARNFGGTGLGLAISKILVNLMGGDIWVTSAVGIGSTFSFTCQLKLESQSAVTKRVLPNEDLTVFYVTAHLQESATTCQTLTELGFRLRVFSEDEIQRWDIQNQNQSLEPVDILVVETVETACALRAHSFLSSTPIVLFNSKQSAPLRVHMKSAFNLGIVSYIMSPDSASSNESSLVSTLQDRSSYSKARQTTPFSDLLAEDNEVFRLVAIKALKGCASDITVVSNGLQALREYQGRQYDVVVMDVKMPVMGGLEATSKIRQYEKDHNLKRTPGIALTADTMPGDHGKCLEAGMDEYVSKPLNQDQLLKAIFSWILQEMRP